MKPDSFDFSSKVFKFVDTDNTKRLVEWIINQGGGRIEVNTISKNQNAHKKTNQENIKKDKQM